MSWSVHMKLGRTTYFGPAKVRDASCRVLVEGATAERSLELWRMSMVLGGIFR